MGRLRDLLAGFMTVPSPKFSLVWPAWAVALLLAAAALLGWFWLDGNQGINLSDEGYLWYGVDALRAGQIPIRDFQAYDPGRYVWITAWSYLLGDGLVAMRAACTLFGVLGVTCGLLAARRLSTEWRFQCLCAFLLAQWMIPRFKLFEQSIALMALLLAVRLLEAPTPRRFFCTGVFIGLMAFMGHNHGAYLLVAFGALFAFLLWGRWREIPKALALSGAGIALGYLPQILLCVFAPGYLRAFLAMLGDELFHGTNLARAVPWPWKVADHQAWVLWADYVMEGCFYVLVVAFFLAAFVRLARAGRQGALAHPLVLGAAAVALPYAHFTFSRPDWVHLAHSVPVVSLGVLALWAWQAPKSARALRAITAGLLGASLLATALKISGISRRLLPYEKYTALSLRGECLEVQDYTAGFIKAAATMTEELARADEPVAFIAHLPGLYPVTGRLSPLKQLYFIWPATPEDDRALLAAIRDKGIRWLLLQDESIDGRRELLFHNTHPLTFEFLMTHYELLAMKELPANSVVLHLREP